MRTRRETGNASVAFHTAARYFVASFHFDFGCHFSLFLLFILFTQRSNCFTHCAVGACRGGVNVTSRPPVRSFVRSFVRSWPSE